MSVLSALGLKSEQLVELTTLPYCGSSSNCSLVDASLLTAVRSRRTVRCWRLIVSRGCNLDYGQPEAQQFIFDRFRTPMLVARNAALGLLRPVGKLPPKPSRHWIGTGDRVSIGTAGGSDLNATGPCSALLAVTGGTIFLPSENIPRMG